MLFSSLIYEIIILKIYLIIVNLYMRYAFFKFIKLIIYIINVLFIMFIQNLYKRFDKKKIIFLY